MSNQAIVEFDAADPRCLIDVLVEVVKITAVDGVKPIVETGGKKYSDMVKLVSVTMVGLYDEKLQPDHQKIVDALFVKRQHGYGRTAYNLAHRAHALASSLRLIRNRKKIMWTI